MLNEESVTRVNEKAAGQVQGFLRERERQRRATVKRHGFSLVVGVGVFALQLLAHANVVPREGADLALSVGALAVGFAQARA